VLLVQLVLLSLVCSLLFKDGLLLENHIANLHQRVVSDSGLVDHVIHFDQSRKSVERSP
jgi:hypothetical protein